MRTQRCRQVFQRSLAANKLRRLAQCERSLQQPSGDLFGQNIIDSHDEGIEKPDPRLFEIALERSGATRETTIHVGDIYQIDVVGARAAGLRGVLLDQAGLYPGADCPRVRSLADLVDQIAGGTFD